MEDRRILSLLGDSIDYTHSDNVTTDFGNNGYTNNLRHHVNDVDDHDRNVWNLAGFVALQPHSIWYLLRGTCLCVLKQKVERKLNGIAAGSDFVEYKKWNYEVKGPRKAFTSQTFELFIL
ncbi:hypothetical protein Plhal304r1_c077g0164121 [Plasmopara halstedii]